MEQKTTEPVEISNSAAEKDKNHETETGEISKEKKTDPFQSYSEQHKPDGVYIRIGSFSEKSNADSLLKTLIHSGYNAFYRHEDTGKKGKYYRIYIDGYKSKKDAMNDAEMLKGSGLIPITSLTRN
jgi:cell division septation protein DedD